MYEVSIGHDGLHKYRIVKGYTQQEAELKASLQQQIWDEQWQKVVQRRDREDQRNKAARLTQQRKSLATDRDKEASELISSMDTLLASSASMDHIVDWASFKHHDEYKVRAPEYPKLASVPPEPAPMQEPASYGFLAALFPSVRAKRKAGTLVKLAQQQRTKYDLWVKTKERLENWNKNCLSDYYAAIERYKTGRDAFLEHEAKFNEAIDVKRAAYLRREPDRVVEYCEMVLDASSYPETFPSSFDVEYVADTRTLVVDFSLPAVEALPHVKGYKFVASRDEIQELPVSEAWLKKTYDSVLYQITLRTLYELAQADQADALDSIVFNGWVKSIEKATGQEVNACIVTVHTKKDEILEVNMAQVDPKACFKKLKGISAAKLVNLSPVRPILQLSKNDKRFVPAHDVVDGLDESANLAAMDWEEFEHLIRELFEKEFSSNGGEVKITQASRDGGVDAIAFDEDPIRGGKIVIQAKRYTNTVSVSAVRDLYGTILNEGANKGILVTTADYGPDAYEFAKGKPITLLSGNELLYLLQKHGHKARINLAEARALAAQQVSVAKASS